MIAELIEQSVAGDPRWARIVARDHAADGAFWYSVLTTGVYCRPSCASRQANPENVQIHGSIAEARATGFRACKRCDPEGPSRAATDAGIVAAVCRAIEEAEAWPGSAALAAAAGCSAGHLHRLFKAATGLTPRGYAAAHRAGRVRAALAAGEGVTTALHGAGYGSAARFYEGAAGELGMTPARFASGGAGETLRYATGEASLGTVLVAASAAGIAAILIGDDAAVLREELGRRFPRARLEPGDGAFAAQVAQVVATVEQPRRALDLPLDIRGTAFQRRVWQALRAIPAGTTMSYAEVATAIGRPEAARAVAGACAANALAVAIPCHRVVRQGGALSGYRWGVARKAALLSRESGA